MPENNKRQALVIEGATVIPNPRGTAPGMHVEADGVHYFLLPGPPTELKPMYAEQVLPMLRRIQGERNVVITSRYLRTFGIGESTMEMAIKDLIGNQSNPTIAPYASEGEAMLRITASAGAEAQARALIEPIEQSIRERIGKHIYGVDEETLPVKLGKLLRERGQKMGTAESCTGGLIGMMITDVAGSSDYYYGSVVSYDNSVKQNVLGVTQDVLAEHGAVSEACARQMAIGARQELGTDWAVSVTGIAGPGGGTEEKPVGLIYVGISGPGGTTVKEHRLFRGDRQQIRLRAAKTAMHDLIQRILSE